MFKVIKVLSIPATPHIFICRHGHTALNEAAGTPDKIRGWVDVPLNDEGRKDAEEARKTLLANTTKVDKIYVSNLSRTIETASIINQKFNAPTVETESLRPWNLGELQGQETKGVMPVMEMFVDHPDSIVPKGESFNSFKNRYLSFLKEVIKEAKTKDLTLLLVTHFRNVKMAQAWIAEGMKDDLSVDGDIMSTNDCSPGDIFELPIKY